MRRWVGTGMKIKGISLFAGEGMRGVLVSEIEGIRPLSLRFIVSLV